VIATPLGICENLITKLQKFSPRSIGAPSRAKSRPEELPPRHDWHACKRGPDRTIMWTYSIITYKKISMSYRDDSRAREANDRAHRYVLPTQQLPSLNITLAAGARGEMYGCDTRKHCNPHFMLLDTYFSFIDAMRPTLPSCRVSLFSSFLPQSNYQNNIVSWHLN
jgi:hypothetical protein